MADRRHLSEELRGLARAAGRVMRALGRALTPSPGPTCRRCGARLSAAIVAGGYIHPLAQLAPLVARAACPLALDTVPEEEITWTPQP